MDLNATEKLARELMEEYNLLALGWTFCFDRATRRAGLTSYSKRTISLSRELTLLGSREDVLDTILHEIAHALTPGASHGPLWKKKFIELGGSGNVVYRLSDESSAQLARNAKYRSACEICGGAFGASRKSKHMGASYCLRTELCRSTNNDSLRRRYLVWSDRDGRIVRGETAILLGIGA